MIMGVDRIFFCLDLYEIYKAHVEYSRYISFIFVFNSPEPKMMWIYLFFSLPKFGWCDLPDTRSGLFNIVSNATTNVLFCCPCINNLSYMSVNNFINVLKRYFGRIFFYFIKHIFWNFFTSHDQFLLVWGLGLVVLAQTAATYSIYSHFFHFTNRFLLEGCHQLWHLNHFWSSYLPYLVMNSTLLELIWGIYKYSSPLL